ncbi:MAG: DUF2793 domain-containing protein [Parvularcula sp.]|jgi:hypothetical protein|nr:DUF2793 domain-containing protein [Parvularcula sp.]
MTMPIAFPSTTNRFVLPLLSVGQAQKEVFINQALSIVDTVLQAAVDGSVSAPPAEPAPGSCYRILAGAQAEWTGHDGELALWIGGAWTFVPPSDGMSVFDRASGNVMYFNAGWYAAAEPALPAGGETVDAEARAAILGLISALRTAGILPASAA